MTPSTRPSITLSQKPFGFIGISACSRTLAHMIPYRRGSQKPFGFIGISAITYYGNTTRRVVLSQKPFGFIGISAWERGV